MCDWLTYGEWCDVKLLCGGRTFNAHRAVLASVSSFLREILLSCQTDDTPTFIVLPDFDLEAMSSVLYYIYNGEVVVDKQRIERFVDIIKAMQIFIDFQYITKLSETMLNISVESNKLHYEKKPPRSDIFTLRYGDCEDQQYYNIKKSSAVKDIKLYSLHKTDNKDKEVQSQNRPEHCNASLGNPKSLYGDRQRNSFLRDLYIETYPTNGNVNGQIPGVLAISNEYYRAPASALMTNANDEHLSAADTVFETYKNPTGIPSLSCLSHPKQKRYLQGYHKSNRKKYLSADLDQFHNNVFSNDIDKISSLHGLCEKKSYSYDWKKYDRDRKRVSLVPVRLNEHIVSDNDSAYLDLSMRAPIVTVPLSSIGNNLVNNNSLLSSLPSTTDDQKHKLRKTNSAKALICNHVLNNPWNSCVPNNFKPFRRKTQELEDNVYQIRKKNQVDGVSDYNNNFPKSISQEVSIADETMIRSNSFKCTVCNQVYTNNEALSVHMRRHSPTSRYSCNECGKMFSQLRNFKYHMSIHRGTREFAATCTVCGKYFNDRGYLSSHMKIHRNRKEYKCSICPKSFNQRVAYNMHMRIHTGIKPHVCEECGKAFSRKMLLKQHHRTHSGERPYACPHCDKRFADRSNMTLHLRLHTGIKPFSCSLCPKSFTKKHHLKSHLNFHTGSKPYSCPLCRLAFTQSSNMRTHMKKCNVVPPSHNQSTPI